MGGRQYSNVAQRIIQLDGDLILGFSATEPRLQLCAKFRDRRGKETLSIEDNAMLVSPTSWDVQSGPKAIYVREGKGEIVLRVTTTDTNVELVDLDMLAPPFHIVSSSHGFAVGRYTDNEITPESTATWLGLEGVLAGRVPQNKTLVSLTTAQRPNGMSIQGTTMDFGQMGVIVQRMGVIQSVTPIRATSKEMRTRLKVSSTNIIIPHDKK
jgi:hypothetical protein